MYLKYSYNTCILKYFPSLDCLLHQ